MHPLEKHLLARYIDTASRSPHPKHKHVAIVFKKGELVTWATNTHYEHAERRAVAIANMYGYKKGLCIISIAINKANKLKLGKPCPPCYTYCKKHGVTEVFYSTNKQTIDKLK